MTQKLSNNIRQNIHDWSLLTQLFKPEYEVIPVSLSFNKSFRFYSSNLFKDQNEEIE